MDDVPFVFDSWLRSYNGSDHAGPLPKHLYWPTYRRVIEELLARETVETVVAVPLGEDLEQSIAGYLVHERGRAFPIVHYLYVKQAFRRLGVCRFLFKAAQIDPFQRFDYTFRTKNTAETLDRLRGMHIIARFRPDGARYPLREAVKTCA